MKESRFSESQVVAILKEVGRSPWRGGVAGHLVRPIAVEWRLLKMRRWVASQDDEWQVPAAAVIGLQNLTGCSQPEAV